MFCSLQNKVPDCKMFLRGACTRENCKYRHVKVSATAGLCEPFSKGYCPKGCSCPLRHELPSKSPTATATATKGQTPSSTASGTLPSQSVGSTSASASSSPTSSNGSLLNDNAELSIRPNIRFASKHSAGFPSLFDGLRRTAK
ncbi:hypothetical protein PHMEG_0001506 [Phytophthora megakarya]|uniref:C3H1-type domain-containing protein n=1 Tax=Phytophthora megakarya TaxID=4795 RepID=A0A225X2X3_9STRA|nr:hypothetical protein PHMEG_0001506 [Phytophthora megakarya]